MTLETGKSSSQYRTLSRAAMLVAAGLTLPPAFAADLGGNCCADLEERVAELEATVARKGNRRVSLTISGQVHTSVMAWDAGGQAKKWTPGTKDQELEDVKFDIPNDGKGTYTGDITIPGTNATYVKGNAHDVYIVDQVGGTGFALSGDAKISPDLTAGFNVTFGINSGARSHQVSQFDDDAPDGVGSSDSTIVMTLANWYLDHKQVGRLTVGRANTATSGITGIDLGGAGAIANVNVGWWNASFLATGTGYTWGQILGGSTVNGSTTSRGNVVNYTTPTVSGFQAAAAWGENDVWDVALRYAGEFSGLRVAAGVGYNSNGSGTNEVVADIPANSAKDTPSQWKGSASVMHVASGLFLTGAYIDQDNADKAGADNTTLWYVQGGIAKNWTGVGNTVLYAEYADVDNGVVDTNLIQSGTQVGYTSANVWGLGVVQHIDAAAMELYLSYRHYDGTAPGLKFADEASYCSGVDTRCLPGGDSDFDVVVGGARIKF